MRIAMAQISSGDDPAANLRLVTERVAEAADAGASLVVFPEATMCRFGVRLAPIVEPLDGPWATGVAEAAQRHRITVVAGMFTPADGDRFHNTALIARPGAAPLGYRKIHLYDAFGFRESDTVAPGDEPVTFEVDGVTIGVATCYDIRFPQLFTALARRGAELIVVPTSWGAGPGKIAQWQVLATARALDSTSFVAAVGQALPTDPEVRKSKAPTGIGHSRLTDPFGSVIADYDDSVRLGVHDIDLAAVGRAREALAVLANERSV